jgi:hypothetical protein
MGRKFGFHFSWKRATGLSGAKRKISRQIGIPLTRSGRRKKVKRATGCFIATATYGDENAPEVKFFRTFRNEYLLSNRAGCQMTRLYYLVAPYIAWIIEKTPFLKRLTRKGLTLLIKMIESHTNLRQ